MDPAQAGSVVATEVVPGSVQAAAGRAELHGDPLRPRRNARGMPPTMEPVLDGMRGWPGPTVNGCRPRVAGVQHPGCSGAPRRAPGPRSGRLTRSDEARPAVGMRPLVA